MTSTPSFTNKGNIRLYNVSHLENNESNFVYWKIQLQAILEMQNLWEIVDGTNTQPEPNASAMSTMSGPNKTMLHVHKS